jgi:hypothetical protein
MDSAWGRERKKEKKVKKRKKEKKAVWLYMNQ